MPNSTNAAIPAATPAATYAIAIGSNRPSRHGRPAQAVRAAIAALPGVTAISPLLVTPPLGPSLRRFANAVVLLDSTESPPELLTRLKAVERAFGRRRAQRWGARVIDLDIILWSGGTWRSQGLTVPHTAFRTRDFVLLPLVVVAPDWRDPVTGKTVRHLAARLRRSRPRVDPTGHRS